MDTEDQDIGIESFQIRDCTISVVGITPYSPSRHPGEEKKKNEEWDEFEARTWRKKAHTLDDGTMFIPGDGFKLALDDAVRNLNLKIPGKGNQTYTGVVKMGVTAIGDLDLGVNIKDLKAERVYCHAGGKRTDGTRVNRLFPILHEWKGNITLRIFNDSLTQERFEYFFAKSGLLVGVGRGRPGNGCPRGNGRYRPVEFKWENVT